MWDWLKRLTGRKPADSLGAVQTGYSLTGDSSWLTGSRNVTADSAMSLSGVFAAVNLLSRVISTLPLSVYRRRPGSRDKDTAETHPAHWVLHNSFNREMTASVGRRMLEYHRLLHGAACAEIGWDGGGNVRALWPIQAWRVKPERDSQGVLFYRVDGTRRVELEDMIYVPSVTSDGVVGKSFLDYALASLGAGISAQEFAERYFENNARPGGVLHNPNTPKPEALKEFREGWNANYGGTENSNKIAVTYGGWEYKQMSFDPQQSQLLETRRFATEEVARWLNIPPHLLAELSRATFANIEEQGIGFVIYSLMPTLVESEQEYDRKLLSPPDLYCKHNVNALMRGNAAARAEYYSKTFGVGGLSTNDICELEDRNGIGPAGDQRFVPMNMVPVDMAREVASRPKPGSQAPANAPDTPAPTPGDAR